MSDFPQSGSWYLRIIAERIYWRLATSGEEREMSQLELFATTAKGVEEVLAREIEGLGMGTVHAVLFSMEDGNELIAPVAGEYCLLLFLSPYADIRQSIVALKKAVELLKKDIE